MLASMANMFPHKLTSIPKNALISTFLVANAFVWYLCTFKFLQDDIRLAGFADNLLIVGSIIGINILSLIIFATIGTSLIEKFQRRIVFIKLWFSIGIIISIAFAVVNLTSIGYLILAASGIGIYFGLGMPVCMGYFAENTAPENRAKLSGLIILIIGVMFPVLLIANEAFFVGSLALWFLLGLICLICLKPSERRAEQKDQVSYRSVFSSKAFLFYLVPWFMFSFINDLTMPLNNSYFGDVNRFPLFFTSSYYLVENILAGVAAIMFGILADKKGRKRLALIGFVLLGLGYGALGFFIDNLFSAFFYVIADGIAWGAISMLFLFTIWGDLAQGKNSEKYYILGVLPYLISNLTRLSLGTAILNSLISESTIFSFGSFFLFAAVLPLAYAPETLSDRIIRDLDINSYVNKALEKVKKENMKRERVS